MIGRRSTARAASLSFRAERQALTQRSFRASAKRSPNGHSERSAKRSPNGHSERAQRVEESRSSRQRDVRASVRLLCRSRYGVYGSTKSHGSALSSPPPRVTAPRTQSFSSRSADSRPQ